LVERVFSSYVIADPCIGVKDATCVEVCPVDCIESTPEDDQYFVDPALCIACEQCVLVCPVDAIFLEHEIPEQWKDSIERNAAFFASAQQGVPTVTSAQAREIIDGVEAKAGALGIAVSIAIVDQRGELVSSSTTGAPDADRDAAALNKAYTSAVLEIVSSKITDRLVAAAPAHVDRDRLVREAGGVAFGKPYVTGAVGVAGGTADQDQACCRAALLADWA
jgi:uncharacterized protein GlcG (DUF336 family)/NAD-dependent dihydropyrimidine dehydrogenase PreA subunit